jgi:hypothetical protein
MSAIYTRAEFGFDCGLYEQLLRLEGGNINDYIKQLTKFLEQKREAVDKESSKGKVIATMDTSEIGDLVEEIVSYFNNNANKTIFNALFVMTNSYLEWGVVEICRLASIYLKVDYKTYSTRRTGLEKAKEYLQNELNIPIKENDVWQNIKFNQEMRNLFVHNAANLFKDYTKPLKEQDYYQEVNKRNKDIDLIETGFVYIKNMEYISVTHGKNTDFIYEVYNAVRIEMNNRGHK